MNVGTFCSGIGAPEVAWCRRGWKPVFFSEIAAFPSAVLNARWPDVPNLGDMNHVHKNKIFKNANVDIICAGTPCQSFSLAGLRKGLADPRGNLALQFLRLLSQKRPLWVVWENVPDVLSSWSDAADGPEVEGIGPEHGRDVEQTNDFDTFIAGLISIGYGVAWRILDAQNFGVPQRRERIFVVGYYGDRRRAEAVLFDSQSVRRHPTKGGKAGKAVAGTFTSRTSGGGGFGTDFECDGGLISATVTAKWAKGSGGPAGDECQNFAPVSVSGRIAHTLTSKGSDASEDGTGRGTPIIAFQSKASASQSMNPNTVTPTIDKSKGEGLAVFDMRNGTESASVTQTLMAGNSGHGVNPNLVPHTKTGRGVRRLTPLECERLQGFPDGHTDIIYRGKPAKDGPRYEAIGNSMAVPVLAWIGERIDMVEQLFKS